MSILPGRTTPHQSLGEASQPDVTPFMALPETVELAWRALQPTDATDARTPAYGPAMVRARLHGDGIEIELHEDRERTGLRMIACEVSASIVRRDDRTMRVLRWATDAGESLARIVVEAGQPPVIRTTLPTRLGLPGGTYDLLSITIEE
ncbi:MAG: hypothetical protein CBD91_07210 [Phycisphaeraceae bacterium TMED231]|nr:MAG: hypothetical protein CBD91_07210 [Phycisphaeraceae bacterium TMED231]